MVLHSCSSSLRVRRCWALLLLLLIGVVLVVIVGVISTINLYETNHEQNESSSNPTISKIIGVAQLSPPPPPPPSSSSSSSITNIALKISSDTRTLNTYGDGVVVEEVEEPSSCNGLPNLCNQPVNMILFAMVHNANADFRSGYRALPNHRSPLEDALEAGYRGLNIDFGKCDGTLQLVHSSCAFDTRDPKIVFTNIMTFLNQNPYEVLLINTQINDNADDALALLLGEEEESIISLAEINAMFSSVEGLQDQLYQHPNDDSTPWPTLLELIEADTRILFFHYNENDPSPNPPGFHNWFDYAAETRFSYYTYQEFDDKINSCEITRGGTGRRDFFGLNIFLTPARPLAARRLHRRSVLREHIETCQERNGGLQANVLLVDFWNLGDVLDVVQEYNLALEG